ncbi:hydrogenase maturation protease [Nocardioides sp. BSK12Z-3]|nr:hydrogenase maturation protease [Nocardioides bruguierae]
MLIRTLHQRGFPAGVRLVDGGTSGMDVAFGMRGAAKVVLVDACATGRPPGTLYRMPASELGEVPPLAGLHSHNFRWDHALSLSAWLLGPLAPTDVEVILCEAGSLQPGQPLSAEVQAQVDVVADLLERELYPAPPVPGHVTLTDAGSLHLTASQAERWFPSGLLVARVDEAGEEPVLELVPLAGAGHGGLVLKQRNLAGDRSVLLSEVLGFGAGATVAVPGDLGAHWDDDRGVLRVDLRTRHAGPDPGDGGSDRARGVDRGGG